VIARQLDRLAAVASADDIATYVEMVPLDVRDEFHQIAQRLAATE